MSVGSPTPEVPHAAPDDGSDRPSARLPLPRLALPIIVVLLIAGGVTALLAGGSSKPALPGNASAAKLSSFDGLTLSPRIPAPPLDTLRNYDGAAFNLGGDRGKVVLVTFLYSHCPDVCPLIASNLHNTYERMTPKMRQRVAIVAVSVDPHGDSAGAVGAFVRAHLLSGEADYLIGTTKTLPPVWEAWKVGSQADTSRPDLVNHTALVYGISASGKLTTIYSANFEPGQIVHDVPGLLAS
jgi:protein SCO1